MKKSKEKGKILKKGKKDKNQETTITRITLPTFTTRIKHWGYCDLERQILIENIDGNNFAYNCMGYKGIASVQKLNLNQDSPTAKKPKWGYSLHVEIPDNSFSFDFEGKPAKPIYFVPDIGRISAFVNGEIEPRSFPEIFKDIKKAINVFFEFRQEHDASIVALRIAQSWIVPVLDSVFYLAIDSTAGAGKTTLLEIMHNLARHGFLAGNTSGASVPRLKELYDLDLFIDEIDELNPASESDLVGLIRKGQRRGNHYVRLNKQTLSPETFDAFGCYAFSFRGELEDALMSRTFPIHTPVSAITQLPVINLLRKKYVQPLAEELFFWYMDNLFSCSKCSASRRSYAVIGGLGFGLSENESVEDLRNKLYSEALSGFSENQKMLLARLVGRNIELGFVALDISNSLDFDLFQELSVVLKNKQESENLPDQFYLNELMELMRDVLESTLEGDMALELSKGDFYGFKYYSKNRLFKKFIDRMKRQNSPTIGTPKFNSLLKDAGFIEGYNMKNQRFGKNAEKCLIFDRAILKKLGIEEEGEQKRIYD